jgi:hypothetical protein
MAMKILFWVTTGCLWASTLTAQWNDDFSDGDFSLSPEWQGESEKFTVDNGWLRLNDVAAGTAFLATVSEVASEALWEFVFRMTFNPSADNYAKVYLMSDQPDLSAPLNGYYLRLSGSTDDDICLFRQTGNTSEKLIDGRNGALNASSNTVRVSVTRDEHGLWTLKTRLSGETEDVTEGSASDTQVRASAWFGVACIYTISRSKAFFFDDFYVEGQKYTDREAPSVVSFADNSEGLRLVFSEPVNTATVHDAFLLSGNIFPENVAIDEERTSVMLQLPAALPCGIELALSVHGFADLNGNVMRDTSFSFSIPCRALPNDIVINEIMANPSPPVYLPQYEYVELYNHSDKNIEMEGWSFTYGTTSKIFPPYLFPAKSYLLLAHSGAVSSLETFGTVLPLLGAQSAISNTGQYLSLRDANGTIISWIDFTVDYYADDYKSDGGWALELIDPEQPCPGAFNWKVSADGNGGTPGKGNSVLAANADMQQPHIRRIAVDGNHTIILYASKPLGDISPVCSIEPATSLTDIRVAGNHFDRIQLTLQEPLQEGQWYDLSVTDGIRDCAGYAVPPAHFRFALPQKTDSTDVVFNEILFRPLPESHSFIELYNRSQKAVRISDLQLALRHSSGELSAPVALSEEDYLLLPGQYLVISRNTDAIIRQFNVHDPNCFLDVPDMPSLTKESGMVVLLNRSLQIVDEVHYSLSEHTDALTETTGVSLERLHPDRNSLDPTNWHTAAQTAGFATPGQQNSQFTEAAAAQSGVTLLPEVFSPDNDGIDDVLNICYRLEAPATTVDLIIFDASGRRVLQLLKQQIAGTDGVITWDGFNDSRRQAQTGVYIIYFHAYNSAGFNKIFKLPCVLAGKKR